MKALQAMSPVPLTLIAIIPGAGKDWESALHSRWHKLKHHNEWYRWGHRIAIVTDALSPFLAKNRKQIAEYQKQYNVFKQNKRRGTTW